MISLSSFKGDIIKLMKYISLIIFFVSVAIHLYASLKQDQHLRNISKPFIILALLGYYCFSTDRISLTIVLALLFSWLGDVLLIFKGVKWFTFGGVSFMMSHIFLILSYLTQIDFAIINKVVIVVLPLLFLVIVTIILNRLKIHLPKKLFYPMYLYLLMNGAMNCFAFFRYLSNPSLAGIITLIGAILFFISDCTLFFVRFDKESIIKTHFSVMLTYSLGKFLIISGLMAK